MTILEFQQHKRDKRKLIVVTAYDALFTRIVQQAGIHVILVGDSLGVVVQGKANTLSVTMDDMLYHTKMVARAAGEALVIGDLPFMSYQASTEEAMRNAGRFLQAGATAVKLEGGAPMLDRIKAISGVGIPVMGHLGMTPQSMHALGGYKVQGKTGDQAAKLLEDAKALEAAGAFAIVLEAIPSNVAERITATLSIPTIGIGAGPHCDGQVLVLHDMLGLYAGKKPRFVKDFMAGAKSIQEAVANYVTAVKTSQFPGEEHAF